MPRCCQLIAFSPFRFLIYKEKQEIVNITIAKNNKRAPFLFVWDCFPMLYVSQTKLDVYSLYSKIAVSLYFQSTNSSFMFSRLKVVQCLTDF